MISGINGISDKLSTIYDRIEEIQSYTSLGSIDSVEDTDSALTETEDADELTFSDVLSQVQGTDAGLLSESLQLDQLSQLLDTDDVSFYSSLYDGLSEEESDIYSLISQASSEYGVESALIKAMIQQESQFNSDAVSPAGAMGLMQLMPQTADLLGVDDAFDPEQNIMGGTKYLSMLLDYYDDDVISSLAAYNAGTTAVDNAGGVPNYSETQNYVLKVLQNYQGFKSAE